MVEMGNKYEHMRIALEMATTLRIAELQTMTAEQRMRTRVAWTDHMWAETEGVFSEDILYQSKIPGKTAKAFNALAKVIAALSYCPGGIFFMGVSFETTETKEEAAHD